jgi:hypothetical protein
VSTPSGLFADTKKNILSEKLLRNESDVIELLALNLSSVLKIKNSSCASAPSARLRLLVSNI